MFACLLAAFALIETLFGLGVMPHAAAVQLEKDPFGKLVWFATRPLANAFALFVIRDRFGTGMLAFWTAAAVAAAVVALGYFFGPRRGSRVDRATWLFCLFVLPFAAHGVILAAGVRSMGYRTLFGLAGIVIVLVIYALRSLRLSGVLRNGTQTAVLALLLGTAAVLANRNAFTLIAEPQGREWAIVRDGVQRMPLIPELKVYVIRPRLEDRSTVRVFEDEFGSLSSNSDWATVEMFKTALRRLFPDGLPRRASYRLSSGLEVPYPGAYDYVIDMRTLAKHRTVK
jgi:hypothetical protein